MLCRISETIYDYSINLHTLFSYIKTTKGRFRFFFGGDGPNCLGITGQDQYFSIFIYIVNLDFKKRVTKDTRGTVKLINQLK